MPNYALHRFLLMTLDPVHIGTGGYRLGRVDMSIVREPGTNVPKIPGTSFSGALRQYAAYRYGKIRCAGKGGTREEDKHCGQPTCPICYTFGYAKGEQGGYQGTVNIFDAHIFLFPVHSMAGPVWVSTEERLENAGFSLKFRVESTDAKGFELQDGNIVTTLAWEKSLNLGWIMLEMAKYEDKMVTIELGVPQAKNDTGSLVDAVDGKEWDVVSKRLVLVTEKVFSQVVNSNLEVRTSVSISPKTGAAEEGALFTYEATPRAAWLVMDVVVDDYREVFPTKVSLKHWELVLGNTEKKEKKKLLKEWGLAVDREEEFGRSVEKAQGWVKDDIDRYDKSQLNWSKIEDVLSDSFKAAEFLGVGGMGTRGFGRIRKISEWKGDNYA